MNAEESTFFLCYHLQFVNGSFSKMSFSASSATQKTHENWWDTKTRFTDIHKTYVLVAEDTFDTNTNATMIPHCPHNFYACCLPFYSNVSSATSCVSTLSSCLLCTCTMWKTKVSGNLTDCHAIVCCCGTINMQRVWFFMALANGEYMHGTIYILCCTVQKPCNAVLYSACDTMCYMALYTLWRCWWWWCCFEA